jgi:hypothetical protein
MDPPRERWLHYSVSLRKPSDGPANFETRITSNATPLESPPMTPQYHAKSWLRSPSSNRIGFPSVAIFSDLQKVDLCRVTNRCIGMLIQYISGKTEILGQWRSRST